MTGKATIWPWERSINLDEELKNLRSKMGHLTALESDNLTAVEHDEIQPGKKRKREVELWFENIKKKKSELESIETEFKDKGPSKDLKCRIEKETKEVEELIQQGKFPKGVVLDDHASTRLPMVTTKLVGESFLRNIESIMMWLKQDDVLAIGIWGMGGVGKTTLVKHIHNKLLEDSDIGRQVYWVTASSECSLKKLQNDIGKALSLSDLSTESDEKRKALIYNRFSRLGKCVLIVDDLWKWYPLEQIGIPDLESHGCKLVLTSRKSNVCQEMGCKKVLKIEPLSKQHAWDLFIEILGSAPSEVYDTVAKDIVEECGGLPLALITVGHSMRGMLDVYEWKNALHDMRRPASGQGDMEDKVFGILKFSFDNLKDQRVQDCFLSCVLFPEDREVPVEELVDLWIDEGLLDEIESGEHKVNKGNAILNTLVKSCLLESITSRWDDRRYVQMHDLIRDMAIMITKEHHGFMAKSGLQLEKVPENEQWSKDLVKVSLSYNYIEEIPNDMAPMTMNLSVLLLNHNKFLEEIPESFFVHMRGLKILDISNTHIKRLPDSVSNLENLRALYLRDCYQKIYVPSLKKLTKLRVLDLYGTYLKKRLRGLKYLKSLEKVIMFEWDASDLKWFNRFLKSSPSLTDYKLLPPFF